MRLPSLLGLTTAEVVRLIPACSIISTLFLSPASHAYDFKPIPSPNLDLSQLGRVGLAGDFEAISLYSYQGQNENHSNGSQSVLAQFPNGAFASLVTADASIMAMCPFVMKGGELAGVVVAGNFTSLGGVAAQGAALVNPDNATVTPLEGLSGKVAAVLCDEDRNTVFFGGEFSGLNSTNALAWVGMTGWSNLPFAGLNGPVYSISKSSNGNILFGGEFSGLGNKTTGPSKKDQQVVDISSAKISDASGSESAGFDDPNSIVCNTDGQSGPGKSWLLADGQAGLWRADFSFGFRPTKLRIWNTKQPDHGTKVFRYTAFPSSGIMNLTYTDPETKQNTTCDARCPLSNDKSIEFQDFTFVNNVGMSGFQIDISDWYGSGGGLDGIQLFQDDIYAFAVNDFNEPKCANIEFGSAAKTAGAWSRAPRANSDSDYLSLSGSNVDPSASVVFQPDIKQSGNYTVTIYTPGCNQDSSCAERGSVNVTGTFASGTQAASLEPTQIFQTNNFDKYDRLYEGYVDANSGSFRPSITLSPSVGQPGTKTFVAQRVRFELKSSAGGLNGLYEYNPDMSRSESDLSDSPINKAGMDLGSDAVIKALVSDGEITYVGGNFSTDDFDNIFFIENDKTAAFDGGGLNAEISTIVKEGGSLYVGGNFTDTSRKSTRGLNRVAVYSINDKEWKPLGGGVDGTVTSIVPISLNITADKPETVITLTGAFKEVSAFDKTEAGPADGFAVWVPSKKNWLQNIDNLDVPYLQGQLVASVDVPGGSPFYAGSLSSQALRASNAVTLPISGDIGVDPLPLKIQPKQSSSLRKRAVGGTDATGVVTGYFYSSGDRNMTILGGSFNATASDGSNAEDLVFVDHEDSDKVIGLPAGLDGDATFLTLVVDGDTLWAGGRVSGQADGADVDGLVLYDLVGKKYADIQPPPLSGDDVSVNTIAKRPSSSDVYVGGSFDSAGSLPCPSVCFFTSESQWNRPGGGLTGSAAAMLWSSTDQLLVGGDLMINKTNVSVAVYDVKESTWSPYDKADQIPGPVTALTAGNDAVSRFWVAGTKDDGSPFLMKYDGSDFKSAEDKFGKASKIRGLQVFSLSESHDSSDLVAASEVVLVTGELDLPNFGNASAALFDGNTVTPFILANRQGSTPGSLSQIFSEKQNFFKTGGGKLAVGFVVLIALAIALALIFLLVVIGIIAERLRRKREGYVPAPTGIYDKQSNMERIPPSRLFGALGHQGRGPGGAPMI
ncbi:MAG: hypothetical protein M1825_001829 [Sarcosagium campestre]|nr:MAG: hypothetical protein M1825_001829 [Sarcosagium campestre]